MAESAKPTAQSHSDFHPGSFDFLTLHAMQELNHQAEETPMQSEARLHQLTDSIPGMIYQFQMSGTGSLTFTFVSSGCRELYELEPEAIQQDTNCLMQIIHPGDRPSFDRSIALSAQSLDPWRWEGQVILASGKVKWVQGAARPQQQPNGLVVWSGQFMDVSQRKQIEAILKQINDDLEVKVEERTKALIESQAQFQRLAANIPGMIYRCKLSLEGTWSFPYISEGCQDLYEIPAAQLKQDPFQLIHPEDQPVLQAQLQRSAQTLMPLQQEYRIITPSGLKWLQAIARPTSQMDGSTLWDGILIDVSDRKAAETRLMESEAALQEFATQSQQKAQELEVALQELQQAQSHMIQSEKMSSLGQLVAGVAHEINNPVNFIYGNLNHANRYAQDLLNLLQLYQQHYPEPHSDIQAETEAIELEFLQQDLPKLLNSMKVGADRIQKIVTSLRLFSRMDEAEAKAVDIHEGIDSTLLILQNRLKARPGHPEVQVLKTYDSLPLIECYAGQLNQVFMNILTNALDAIEEANIPDPRLSIRTQLINPNWVRISIADNGPGIPEIVQQRIFDPFFTTKPIGKGTGMGMSISYQIVTEKHGGRLSCRSMPHQGAEFAIEIPTVQGLT